MNKSVWMSLGALAILGLAGNVYGQQLLPTIVSGGSSQSPQPEQCANGQCDSAQAPKGYQMTVQLLTREALEVCQKLCRAGKYAEACYLLKKMHELNPDNQQIRQAFERVNQTAMQARSISEVQSFIRHCRHTEQQRAQTAAAVVQRTQPTVPAPPRTPPTRCATDGTCPATSCPTACGKQTFRAYVRCATPTQCPVACTTDRKGRCKSDCQCGSDCQCCVSTVTACPRPVQHVRTVPAAVVRSCPVLSGRVSSAGWNGAQYVTTTTAKVWKVYVVVVPAHHHAVVPQQWQEVMHRSVAVAPPTRVAPPVRQVVRVSPAVQPVSVFSVSNKSGCCPFVTQHGLHPNWVKHWRTAHPHNQSGRSVVYYVTTPITFVGKEVFFTPVTPVWHQPVRVTH